MDKVLKSNRDYCNQLFKRIGTGRSVQLSQVGKIVSAWYIDWGLYQKFFRQRLQKLFDINKKRLESEKKSLNDI